MLTATTRLYALAPAKVNLSLAVQGKRADGFHELTSLVLGVELFDELIVTATGARGVELTCDDPSLPLGRENLVVRAAHALGDVGRPAQGVRIELRKRIPVAAGLGGGSSDAAMTLLALNELWTAGLEKGELARLGAELGSDVPLFFDMPSAVVRGRGEQVHPTPTRWSGWVVLVFGGWAVSTREAYANWRPADRRSGSAEAPARIAAAQSAAELAPLLVNELEPAVYRTVPQVRKYHETLDQRTGRAWRLSGAGATAFALFDDELEARRIAAMIEADRLGRGAAVVRAVTGSIDDYIRSDCTWKSQKPE